MVLPLLKLTWIPILSQMFLKLSCRPFCGLCVVLYLWLLLILSLVKPQLGNVNICKAPFICSSSLYNNWGCHKQALPCV